MQSTEAKLNTPLTFGMLTTLSEVFENQELFLPPLDASLARSGKGLLLRGMIELKPWVNVDRKRIISIFITQKGIAYLDRLKEN